MIARIWHGVTERTKADAYVEVLRRTGMIEYRETEGNLGAYVLRRDDGERTHFLTLTFWSSMEAVASFAGADVDAAVYYPEDDAFLLEKEPRVAHYAVADGP